MKKKIVQFQVLPATKSTSEAVFVLTDDGRLFVAAVDDEDGTIDEWERLPGPGEDNDE
jgi:hypothetical protein